MEPSSPSGPSLNTSQGCGSMLVALSTPTPPARLSLTEHNLTIPDRPALAARRHSTLSPLHTSRPLRSSPLAGPSIAPEQDGTLSLGALSAPPTPRGGARRLLPLAEASDVAGPGTTQTHRRRRTLSAVLSKMSFSSSASSTSTSTSSASSTSSTSSVPDQPAGKPRRRLRSLGAEDAPPVPPMPAWAHNTMPNRGSQNLSPSPSSSMRSRVYPRPISVSMPSSPFSSRKNLPATSASPRPPPTHGARRGVVVGQGQAQTDARPRSTRLSIAGLPPSTSRNPEENWLTQAAPPKFSRVGLKAQGVVMPVSARDARRMSTMSTTSATARTKSPELGCGAPPRPKPAHVAPSVSHGRVPRPPSTAPSLQLALMPALVPGPGVPSTSQSQSQSQLRSRTSSLASASSTRSHASDGYFGDRSGSDTPPLTVSSTTSASSVSVSFADPPVTVGGLGADEFGVARAPSSPESGVQIQLNDVPVPPEASYDVKGKGKARAVAVDVRPVGSAGSISSMMSQTSWSAYSARSTASGNGNGNESLIHGDQLSFGSRHARAATAPAEAPSNENLKRRKSAIARVWKRVVRSVAHR